MRSMLKAIAGLVIGGVTAIVLAALDHVLAAIVVAVVTVAIVVTLLLFARRAVRRLISDVRGGTPARRSPPRRRVR